MKVIQIGVGHWGVNHKRILFELGVLVDTYDITYGSRPTFPHYDHVVICTPPNTHYGIVKTFLELGKHIFCEKPLAETSEQCRELLDLAVSKNLKLRVGYIERFNPYVKKIQKTHPRLVTFVRENRHYPHVTDNIVIDTAVHDIDLACWFFEEWEPTPIITSHVYSDYSVITLKFTKGVAVIISSWLSNRKVRTINGVSTICSEDILKLELEDFLNGDIKQDWNALHVHEVIDGVNRCH